MSAARSSVAEVLGDELAHLTNTVIPSAARTVDGAAPELKLSVFTLQAQELMGYVHKGVVDHMAIVDALQEIATHNGLIALHGQDEIQRIMANAAGDQRRTKIQSIISDVWPEMELAAYHGLAGDAVMTIGPETESDPVAILLHFLVFFGNAVGRNPHYMVESTRHGTNLFTIMVGQSSKSRKGTSADRVRAVMDQADRLWASQRIHGGLSSGEGVVALVRDSGETMTQASPTSG